MKTNLSITSFCIFHFFLPICMSAFSYARFLYEIDITVHAQLYPALCNPMDYSPIAPLSMGFPRQEEWSGLPFPPPGDLPDLGIEPASPALAGRYFTPETPGNP